MSQLTEPTCPKCGAPLSEVRSRLQTLETENRRLRRENAVLENELANSETGQFVASVNRKTFHKPDCHWASYIVDLIKFSSHRKAVEADYVPCKTCRA